MNVTNQDLLDSNLTLALVRASKQVQTPSGAAPLTGVQAQAATIEDTLSLSTLAGSASDSFTTLLQQATQVNEGTEDDVLLTPLPAQTDTPGMALAQTASPVQRLATETRQPSALPDPLSVLLQQATLSPLAAQLAPAALLSPSEQPASSDVAAPLALSPAAAFSNGQSSTPNPYLVPESAQALAGAFTGGGAESYALMQQALNPPNTTASLDLLI